MIDALREWPVIAIRNVTMRLCESADDGAAIRDAPRTLNLNQASGPATKHKWMQVESGARYLIGMRLERIGPNRVWGNIGGVSLVAFHLYELCKSTCLQKDTRAWAPRFPKPKEAGWIVVVGVKDTRELIALKRVPAVGDAARHVNLELIMPETRYGNPCRAHCKAFKKR
jgi:hypothetical protein